MQRQQRHNKTGYMEQPLPHVQFTTHGLKKEYKSKAWRDISAPFFHVDPYRSETLEGEIDSYLFGDWMFGTIRCNRHRFFREASTAPSEGLNYYFIQLYESGYLEGYCGDTLIQARPGDISFLDTRQQIDLKASPMESLTLIMPRYDLGFDVNETNLHGTLLRRELPLTQLISAHLKQLCAILPELRQCDVPRLQPSTRTLLASGIDPAEYSKASLAPSANSLKQRLHAFIDRHLTDPSLGPAMLIEAFNISRTTLYRAFGKPGVSDYVCYRRLESSLRDMRNQPQQPVSQVAFRWGFSNERQFQRAFKTHFGMTPQEARDQSDLLLQRSSPTIAIQETLHYWSNH
ncbi:AraC-type DNA-binding protein [Vreelandella subterranea]|uniref:AraC-type DNA-binding protein n=1 Tax=Vreelandella subterranea TaxID=416874 RepID=A0A1H9VR19_9GAMM|nr:helix-turn-helix domain-containing protein [Halomonas subterranea]SES23807.1 AraC-type DNA-binding protein [Halomonas subterranea]